jgi:hypothetical protein
LAVKISGCAFQAASDIATLTERKNARVSIKLDISDAHGDDVILLEHRRP